jgi:hypothetical protein
MESSLLLNHLSSSNLDNGLTLSVYRSEGNYEAVDYQASGGLLETIFRGLPSPVVGSPNSAPSERDTHRLEYPSLVHFI